MPEESKLAYDFALELARQLITLSTGILAISVAFSKDIFKRAPSGLALTALALSSVLYLASIWKGVGHIQALTGSLEWAAIEQTSRPADDLGSVRAAQAYLSPTSTDEEFDVARGELASAGVLIGDSAKRDAVWQIRLFFAGTILVTIYGVLMLGLGAKGDADPGGTRLGSENTVEPAPQSRTERSS